MSRRIEQQNGGDRAAPPPPQLAGKCPRPPTNPLGRILRAMKEVLQPAHRISPADDFFEMSGRGSFSAARLATRLDVSVRDIYLCRTAAKLAELMRRRSAGEETSDEETNSDSDASSDDESSGKAKRSKSSGADLVEPERASHRSVAKSKLGELVRLLKEEIPPPEKVSAARELDAATCNPLPKSNLTPPG